MYIRATSTNLNIVFSSCRETFYNREKGSRDISTKEAERIPIAEEMCSMSAQTLFARNSSLMSELSRGEKKRTRLVASVLRVVVPDRSRRAFAQFIVTNAGANVPLIFYECDGLEQGRGIEIRAPL